MLTSDSLTLPSLIARRLEGATLQQVTIGMSGAGVYRVIAPGQPVRYLKVAGGYAGRELVAERERLVWLQGRLPVPEALAFACDDERACLLLSEVSGLMACDPAFEVDIPSLVRLYADALRQVHALDRMACPFDMRLDRRIPHAARRMRADLVKVEAFDDSRQGFSPAVLFERLVRERPGGEDLVVTHGDYCLPNVLIDPERRRVSGYIDLARTGVADRYMDLALAARSLAYNFGPGYEPLLGEFWDTYGLEQPDLAKVAYYQLLDEFF